MLHDLKIAPEWFETVKSGVKTFEVRKDDRDFKPNDVLLLREFDGTKYTGRQLKVDVRFVLRNEYCREGYCIMSIVMHGEWKDITISDPYERAWERLKEYKCTVCGFTTHSWCPNCGTQTWEQEHED